MLKDSRVTIHCVPDVPQGGELPTKTLCGVGIWKPNRELKPDVLFTRYPELVTCEECRVKLGRSVPEPVQGNSSTEGKG